MSTLRVDASTHLAHECVVRVEWKISFHPSHRAAFRCLKEYGVSPEAASLAARLTRLGGALPIGLASLLPFQSGF